MSLSPILPSYLLGIWGFTNWVVCVRYEQLTLRANALREELHTETMRMLNDVIKFKMHVQKSLEEYESFVADELEKELGSDEMRDDTQGIDM